MSAMKSVVELQNELLKLGIRSKFRGQNLEQYRNELNKRLEETKSFYVPRMPLFSSPLKGKLIKTWSNFNQRKKEMLFGDPFSRQRVQKSNFPCKADFEFWQSMNRTPNWAVKNKFCSPPGYTKVDINYVIARHNSEPFDSIYTEFYNIDEVISLIKNARPIDLESFIENTIKSMEKEKTTDEFYNLSYNKAAKLSEEINEKIFILKRILRKYKNKYNQNQTTR